MRRSHSWRWLAVVAVALVAAVALAACGGDDDDDGEDGEAVEVEQFPAGTTMAELQEKGRITIGVKFDVPPFGVNNPQTGEVEGFDVDLGEAIAERLGVETRYLEATSDNRIPLLRDGTIDLILSTMTITGERDEEIDFSEPYYLAGGRVLVPEDSDIEGVEDLNGRSVCTARGSTYQQSVEREAPDADLRLIDNYARCLDLIQTGAVDAISTDDVILTGMVIQDDSLKLVGDTFTTEPYGAGVTDGDTEFQEFVSEVVTDYKEDGRWDEAYERWIGQHTGESAEPPEITLEEALEENP